MLAIPLVPILCQAVPGRIQKTVVRDRRCGWDVPTVVVAMVMLAVLLRMIAVGRAGSPLVSGEAAEAASDVEVEDGVDDDDEDGYNISWNPAQGTQIPCRANGQVAVGTVVCKLPAGNRYDGRKNERNNAPADICYSSIRIEASRTI